MKFTFWSGWNRRDIDTAVVAAVLSVPAPQKSPAIWRVAPPPAPVPVNPVVREMETALSVLVYRVSETLAKTALYVSANVLASSVVPTDGPALCAATDRKARELQLHPEIKHPERYVTQTAEMIAALRTAEHAASLLRLLCADESNVAALPIIRRVADACERVIRHGGKLLEVPAPDVFTWSNSVVAGQNDIQTAVYNAITLLGRESASLTPSARKMARAAIWMMEVAAETTAHAALECRGVVLPSPALPREPSFTPIRAASELRHGGYAPV